MAVKGAVGRDQGLMTPLIGAEATKDLQAAVYRDPIKLRLRVASSKLTGIRWLSACCWRAE